MSSSENTPENDVSNERAPGFQLLNPSLVSALVTFVVMTLISGGSNVWALLPVYEGGPLFVSAYGDDARTLLGIPAGVLFLAWIVSGYAGRRRWLQIVVSIASFAATIAISLLLAAAPLAAGMAH
jgi:hypothetical protein